MRRLINRLLVRWDMWVVDTLTETHAEMSIKLRALHGYLEEDRYYASTGRQFASGKLGKEKQRLERAQALMLCKYDHNLLRLKAAQHRLNIRLLANVIAKP